jgi:YbgC/YbaW family acyl-CoA thioester hydrolase
MSDFLRFFEEEWKMSKDVSELSAENVHEYKIQIREFHLDTFGHVNNAAYMQIFEDARWEVITSRGFGLNEVTKTAVGPTILECRVQFKREIKNRENIVVRTWVSRHAGKITTLRQVMINEKGEEACSAEFVSGLFDLNTRRLIEPTPEWARAIGLSAE